MSTIERLHAPISNCSRPGTSIVIPDNKDDATALHRSVARSWFFWGKQVLLGWALGIVSWFAVRAARHRQRAVLAQLDDRLLRDIGKSRREMEIEVAKPFWRK